jgi:hypothetical protein
MLGDVRPNRSLIHHHLLLSVLLQLGTLRDLELYRNRMLRVHLKINLQQAQCLLHLYRIRDLTARHHLHHLTTIPVDLEFVNPHLLKSLSTAVDSTRRQCRLRRLPDGLDQKPPIPLLHSVGLQRSLAEEGNLQHSHLKSDLRLQLPNPLHLDLLTLLHSLQRQSKAQTTDVSKATTDQAKLVQVDSDQLKISRISSRSSTLSLLEEGQIRIRLANSLA